jgi:hypothetical protein
MEAVIMKMASFTLHFSYANLLDHLQIINLPQYAMFHYPNNPLFIAL